MMTDEHDECPFCNPRDLSIGVAMREDGAMFLVIDGFPLPISIEQVDRLAAGFKEAGDWYRWIQEVDGETPL